MRRGGAGKRRDANEAAIIDGLRRRQAQVWQVSGADLPDLLVLRNAVWLPLAIKTVKGKLTKTESQGVPWPIVRTVDEAEKLLWQAEMRADVYGIAGR